LAAVLLIASSLLNQDKINNASLHNYQGRFGDPTTVTDFVDVLPLEFAHAIVIV
jgi:hypothetical protein